MTSVLWPFFLYIATYIITKLLILLVTKTKKQTSKRIHEFIPSYLTDADIRRCKLEAEAELGIADTITLWELNKETPKNWTKPLLNTHGHPYGHPKVCPDSIWYRRYDK